MKNLSVANRWNADLIDEQYHIWMKNPESLAPEWRAFFEGFCLGSEAPQSKNTTAKPLNSSQWAIMEAIQAYRALGHTQADINPLDRHPKANPQLSNNALGLSEAALAESHALPVFQKGKSQPGKDLLKKLQSIYTGTVGYEYMHIQDAKKREWLQNKIENEGLTQFTSEQKLRMLDKITQAEEFERFLHTRFVGQKRFSIEGGEALMAGMDLLAQEGPSQKLQHILVGMAHRGRLNILTNYIGKSHVHLFRDFTEGYLPDNTYGDGDVKYHLGYDKTHTTTKGASIRLSLAYNPSHLEAVNAIISGQTRAYQDLLASKEASSILPVMIHGDAAVIGQGVVTELLNLSRLEGYKTNGALHIVINNQIGFTTNPADSRSTPYCTDFAKAIEAPVFHVNGDDPVAFCQMVMLALEYRQAFNEDVFIDLICYRKYGHNEADEPLFTQPKLYKQIPQHPAVSDALQKALTEANPADAKQAESLRKKHLDFYEKALEQAKIEFAKKATSTAPQEAYSFKPTKTALSEAQVKAIVQAITTVPQGFSINSKIERQLQAKKEALDSKENFDWSMGEALAFGGLLLEGHDVRISGQDCRRGTFSHRHAVWVDAEHITTHTPLNHISEQQGYFRVYNSALSEEAVLGFDYGYSLSRPNDLTIWEAQFGDFANGAQVMIDQFIVSAESKWGSLSPITLLLPHGYEGQGPEHSSARLERFLQACAENNIQVCNTTTPAQLCHLLRRQIKQTVKKPLVIMSPKSLLRHKSCVSSLSDFTNGSFQTILPDTQVKKAKRLIFCTGKVYYDLLAAREARQDKETALIRVEQLYPLETELLKTILESHKGVSKIVWCQEEPKNMGAYSYIAPLLEEATAQKPIYAGRKASASPAVGSLARHKIEQAALLEQAFTL
jgi:2-oxoglutarate dehydrogenase E1 component